MATEINAGRVAMVPKGEWSASTAYTSLDVVQHGGSAWVCIQDGTGQEPALGSTYWQLLAGGVDSSNYYTKSETNTKLGGKQDSLVSGQNIKTVNGQSVLGTGNLELGELFVVTMTQHNSVYTADKSVSEIYEASYTNGKPVIAIMRDINTPILILTDCDPDADSYVFSAIESNIVTTLRWQRSDDYTYELETMVLQPHLVSGTNIKTVNNEILLGSGNVDIVGKSAYQSYVDTTTDSPVKTEAEWVASLKGEDGVDLGQVAIADNLTTDDATKVLSAKQGYVLNENVKDVSLEVNGRLTFTLGQITVTTGAITSSTTRAYTEKIKNPSTVYFGSGVKVSPHYYDADGTYRGYDEWVTGGTATLNTSYAIVRIVASYTNDATISDASTFNSSVRVKSTKTRLDKIEGDISLLDTRVGALEDEMVTFIAPVFEIGTISTNDGADETSSTTVRTGYFNYYPYQKIVGETGYKFAFRWYKADDTFISTPAEWLTGTKDVADYAPTNGAKYRLIAALSGDATISDASVFNSNVRIKTPLSDAVQIIEGIQTDVQDIKVSLDSLSARVSVVENSVIFHINEGFVLGQIDYQGRECNDRARARTGFFEIGSWMSVSCENGKRYSYRWYTANKEYISYSGWKTSKTSVSQLAPINAVYFRLVASFTDDATITDASLFDTYIDLSGPIGDVVLKQQFEIERLVEKSGSEIYSSHSSVGNCAIVSAKQHTFNDGTPPLLEWYLLADTDNKIYMSRDLSNKTYLATFTGSGGISSYSWGILPNGDIIACKMASELSSGGSDDNRVNPYVFKASESWAIQHTVDFGTSLKPCGWLENCGFTTLPDGSSMFAEYTRITVATCNCWKIVGDPLDKTNWVVKKTFNLSGQVDSGFKHAHMVTVDFYTGVIYLATGDDNTGAMVFASTDGGDTWTQLREASELYCRMLMMTFTEDYIYWAQDTPSLHYFYRGERDVSGVLDYSTVTQYVAIPGDVSNYFASYGQAFLHEYNAVLLLDRQDSGDAGQTMPIRVITLTDGQIHTIGSLKATDGGGIGFRTMFSEWYPVGGLVRVGFGFQSPAYNKNKVCGNKYPINKGRDSVNNLWMKVNHDGTNWTVKFGTYYL